MDTDYDRDDSDHQRCGWVARCHNTAIVHVRHMFWKVNIGAVVN